jgi:uncharacterized cofD-like protein
MSEQPVDLNAIDNDGHIIYGEVNIDQLKEMPAQLMLEPQVQATREAVEAIEKADLILIGPGSFLTSLMPLLLLDDLTQALRRTRAHMIYIGNLGKELSVAAAALTLPDKLKIMEDAIGGHAIDAVVVGPKVNVSGIENRIVVQETLEASDIPYRHDRDLLRMAIEKALQQLG